MERPSTHQIILKIEETQKIIDNLIKYYKALEKLLRGTPTAKYAKNVRQYLERLKKIYLEQFKNEMVKLNRKAEEAIREHEKAIRELQKQKESREKQVRHMKKV